MDLSRNVFSGSGAYADDRSVCAFHISASGNRIWTDVYRKKQGAEGYCPGLRGIYTEHAALLQICFLYYALAFSGNSIGIIATGIIALGVYHGAYVAEVIRAGIEAIPKGQFEAAESQGFDYFQKMYYIILPQSVKIILPPMVNQVVNLVKNTSCLYIIGGTDLISVTYSFVTGASTGGAYAPGVSAQRPAFLCYLLPSVHTGKRVGELVKEAGCKSDCDRRSCSIKERGE